MTGFVVRTERLGLREMTLDDLDFMSAMLGDPEVTRFYAKTYSRADAVEWIEKQLGRYERDGHGGWLAIELASGEPVGQITLALQEVEAERVPEVGYMIHRPFWRRGFAVEGAAAVRDHAFTERGYDRVISLVRPENIPSMRTALRLGMKPERLATFADLPHLVFAATSPRGTTR